MNIVKGKIFFNRIVTGFAFNLGGQLLGSWLDSDYFNAIFCTIGWFYIIDGIMGLRHVMRNPFPKGYRALLSFYMLLVFIMIIRGYMIDYQYPWVSTVGMINAHLFVPTYIWCYFMPVIAFIPSEYYSFDKLIRYSIVASLLYIVVSGFNFQTIMLESANAAISMRMEDETGILKLMELGVAFAFIVLCEKYVSKKTLIINIICLVFALSIAVLCARRGVIVIILSYFIIFTWSRLNTGKLTTIVGFVIAAIALLVVFRNAFSNSHIFDFLMERGVEDTREGVDAALYDQMNTWEMIFGKGLNGRYYYPMGGLTEELFKGWRYSIETGFNNLVLKGGYALAITYVLLLLIPGFKGVFKSNNSLCKVGGAYILLSVAELYPFGILSFNIKFLIIWMCIVLCMSPKTRQLSDTEIYDRYFKSYSKIRR